MSGPPAIPPERFLAPRAAPRVFDIHSLTRPRVDRARKVHRFSGARGVAQVRDARLSPFLIHAPSLPGFPGISARVRRL